jgi:Ca2+/Na+ antiporter
MDDEIKELLFYTFIIIVFSVVFVITAINDSPRAEDVSIVILITALCSLLCFVIINKWVIYAQSFKYNKRSRK